MKHDLFVYSFSQALYILLSYFEHFSEVRALSNVLFQYFYEIFPEFFFCQRRWKLYKKISEKLNTYSRNAKERNSHVIQPTKGLSFAVQKPLTCLCCCYNTNKILKRNEKSHFMMDVIEHFSDFCGRESYHAFYWEKTEHKGGACYLENKSIMHKSPVIVATISL